MKSWVFSLHPLVGIYFFVCDSFILCVYSFHKMGSWVDLCRCNIVLELVLINPNTKSP
jgi:hypothetical protein